MLTVTYTEYMSHPDVFSPSFLPSTKPRKKGKAALAARNRKIDFLHAGVTESDKSRTLGEPG